MSYYDKCSSNCDPCPVGLEREELLKKQLAQCRAAALGEAAKLCDEYGREGDLFAKEYASETADEIAARIRALAGLGEVDNDHC